ncbi:hypothetical protein R1sor_018599 [Riccia sorocarpa]|uniref:EVE domain-containing protein n=1 Tax=Riccia sorocarpa TaxID=122646 RepID=A0ABD3IA77_9MARC
MGNYWLLKTEPDCWSWDQQTANKGLSVWDGVRNHQAQKAMRNMAEGDLCFFYHTGKLKEVCGIVRVVREYYPDPTDETGKWGAVDVQEVLPLKRTVTLGEMKDDDELSEFLMFRQPRLSVVPVEEKVWTRVCNMGEIEPPLLESSFNTEEEDAGVTNGSSKRSSSTKAVPKNASGGKSNDASEARNGEPPKSPKKRAAKGKAKSTAARKQDKLVDSASKRVSSAKIDVSKKPAPPAKAGRKRVNEVKPDPDEDQGSPKASKKRASRAKPVSKEEPELADTGKPPSKKSRKRKPGFVARGTHVKGSSGRHLVRVAIRDWPKQTIIDQEDVVLAAAGVHEDPLRLLPPGDLYLHGFHFIKGGKKFLIISRVFERERKSLRIIICIVVASGGVEGHYYKDSKICLCRMQISLTNELKREIVLW